MLSLPPTQGLTLAARLSLNQCKLLFCLEHTGLLFDIHERPNVLNTAAGAAQQPAKKGAGTKMLDDLKKKGKPVTPKLEEMALWLDSMDTSMVDDGQVRLRIERPWHSCPSVKLSLNLAT